MGGITSPNQLCSAVEGMLEELALNRCMLSTFGFGQDHSADLLGQLAKAGQGSYNYIEGEDQIGAAFGESLGGLLTTTHQNVRLELRLAPGMHLKHACTDYPVDAQPDGVLTVDIGDLYAEERRDILLELTVPAADTEGMTTLGRARAQGFSVLAMRSEEACAGELSIQRSICTLESDTMCVPHVERHRCRFITTDALRRARSAANRGNLQEARVLLRTACEALSTSPLAVQGDATVIGLVADINECLNELQHQESYRKAGSKKLMSLEMTHGKQRAMNCVSGDQYSNLSTRFMKAQFQSDVL